MKGHVNLVADIDLIQEAKARGLNLSALFQSALETELNMKALEGDKKKDLFEQLDRETKKVQRIKDQIRAEEDKELTKAELLLIPDVQTAIERIREDRKFLEGNLKKLKNQGIGITRKMLLELVEDGQDGIQV